MKRNLLLKLVWLSIFTMWTVIGCAQKNVNDTLVFHNTMNLRTEQKAVFPPMVKNITAVQISGTSRKKTTSNKSFFKPAASGPNLTPYKPSGWDNKIVLSTVTGTHTSASTIYDNQTIYLDWAVINNGSSDITQTFYSKLYVDGVLQVTYTSSGLQANYYMYYYDQPIGPLSAGLHTFKIVVDANNNISESDENDNEDSITITIQHLIIPNISITPPTITINQTKKTLEKGKSLPIGNNPLVYVHRLPDSLIVSTYVDNNGKKIDIVRVPGIPPKSYRAKAVIASSSAVTLNVPAFSWSFGCSATSAAMIAGYYDNNGYPNMYNGPTNGGVMPMTNASWGSVVINGETRSQCPLSATRKGVDGRTIRGHVDDYWVKDNSTAPDPYITNGWTQHKYGDCTGDYMKASQSAYGNIDGSTSFRYFF